MLDSSACYYGRDTGISVSCVYASCRVDADISSYFSVFSHIFNSGPSFLDVKHCILVLRPNEM